MTAPSDTGAVLHQYAAAWQAGDLARIFDLYHDEFTLHYYGRNPLAGTHQGKAAATQALSAATARSRRVLEEVVDVLAGDRLGALVVRERLGPADGAGDARRVQRVLLFRVEDGRLRECRLYDEDQRFVDRLWADGT